MPALSLKARIALVACIALIAACAGARGPAADVSPSATAWGPEVQQAFARVRAATSRFHDLDSAVAAGYGRNVPRCIAHPHHGAMGFHHVNSALVDRQLEVERPEILVFERGADGHYTLNGVEYIVPYARWPRDSVPPQIMGVSLLPADDLGLWYLHMWVWKNNELGLFAPWNPAVRCPAS